MTTEPLEPRRLFASLTFITHGYNGDTKGWVATAVEDVQDRAGGKVGSSIYTMSVAAKSGKLRVTNFTPDTGQTPFTNTTNGDLILKLDWSTVSNGTYTTQDVADVVNSYFQSAHGTVPALAELPMHLIGHSRGASLMTALAQDLGQAGIWVDQQTNLDPHPVDGKGDFLGVSFGDQKMSTFDNVAFADTYWRTDGNANDGDFDGEPVAGSYNSELTVVQDDHFVSAHQAVTAYYNGTIDTTSLDGGDHPVIPSWYKNTKAAPARTKTGFAYSTLGGLGRPNSGVSTLLGGKGKRSAAGEDGGQWANAFGVNTRKVTSISVGEGITAQLYVQDRDSKTRVNVFFDTDQNPYNTEREPLTGKTFSAGELSTGKVLVPTTGVNPGSYYVAVAATDSVGHTRWNYTPYKVTVSEPDFASLSGGVLTVNGTDGNDFIRVIRPDANTVIAELGYNEQRLRFSAGDVDSIVVMAGEGNDSVSTEIDGNLAGFPMYVNGGPGKDTLSGGPASDTLTGGAQNDSIFGDAGDDKLNGNGGRNYLNGGGGNDRLYAGGSGDTLVGGGNVDRLFGGGGRDSLVGGGGNDKLYGYGNSDTLLGNAGADLLDGGSGTDSADDDSDDMRTAIEVLLP